LLKDLIRPIVPLSVVRAYRARGLMLKAATRFWDGAELETRLLPELCDPTRVAVDVGGNVGAYTWHIARYARACHVFEPIPDLASQLGFAFALDWRVHVHRVALSDVEGQITLRVPVDAGYRINSEATIERANVLSGRQAQEIVVRRRRLDDMQLGAIGFAKIDVEGHELAVLRGGEMTLRTHRPKLLIEIEERHRPHAIASVREFIEPLGYMGAFLLDGELVAIDRFDPQAHDTNNFVFIAKD
jgi:FkbM family methyltransferase